MAHLSKTDRFRILARDHFTCRYCGQSAPAVVLEVDHIHPRSSGGKDTMENLTTACQDCNRGKADGIMRRAVKLSGGPFDGVEMQTVETFPLFWVYEKEGHGIFHVSDGWRTVKVSGRRIASHFPKLMHPITGSHPYAASYDALWTKPYPTLIGLYGWVPPGAHASDTTVLEYSDPDMLLLRMTDLYFAMDAQEWDEATLWSDEDFT